MTKWNSSDNARVIITINQTSDAPGAPFTRQTGRDSAALPHRLHAEFTGRQRAQGPAPAQINLVSARMPSLVPAHGTDSLTHHSTSLLKNNNWILSSSHLMESCNILLCVSADCIFSTNERNWLVLFLPMWCLNMNWTFVAHSMCVSAAHDRQAATWGFFHSAGSQSWGDFAEQPEIDEGCDYSTSE